MILSFIGNLTGDDFTGLAVAVLVTAYLVYALLAPEKL
jgi:K+-transporting ATPase KdpF subunit